MVLENIHERDLDRIQGSTSGEVIIVERARGVYLGHPYREIKVNFRDCNRVAEFRVFQIEDGQGIQLPLRL